MPSGAANNFGANILRRNPGLRKKNFKQKTFDPLGQPKVTAGRDHCFRTCRPFVSTFQLKSRKTKQQKTMFTTGVTMGLAKWIKNFEAKNF